MKANPLACALLVLLAIAIQLPAQPPATNAVATNKTSVCQISARNPDGSCIQASFEWEIEFIDELVSAETDTATKATSNKFSMENLLLAEKGDATAQGDLGYRYFDGFGFAKDFVTAAKWFRLAADQGNVLAENNLGACYANGFGVEKNEAEAAKWYRKAAEQDDGDAQYCLGRGYETGSGVEINVAEASKWYHKAADNRNASAQEWIRKAAENGDASEQHNLGVLYARGFVGVNNGTATSYIENPVEAVKWYRRAAAQGYAAAQNNLGMMYEMGQGVPQDYVEAYKWYNLAAAQEDSLAGIVATTGRDNVAKEMSSDQIAEAQQLAREFTPRKESSSDNSTSPDSPTARQPAALDFSSRTTVI
jgi:TPR repeat protein